MKNFALACDISAVTRLVGEFKLRSGAVSSEYFDKYRFEADPALLRRVASAMTCWEREINSKRSPDERTGRAKRNLGRSTP